MKSKTSKIAILIAAAFVFPLLTICAVLGAPALPANGKIAFTSDRDGNFEIYLMNPDGTGQTRLTNSPDKEDYPTWSPDGRRIAFLKQAGTVFSINLMNADGTNQTELTRIIPNNIQTYPYERFGMSWSPDGAKIAFQDLTDIFTINTDGSNRVNLTNGQVVNYEPSWSPDGTRIAFARSIYSHGFYPNVYVMNVDGSNVTRITTSPAYGESSFPDWSPDGQKITLGVSADKLDGPSLALIDPDGTNLQFLLYYYPLEINKPKWSPDGTKIVLYRNGYSDRISQIWAVNRDGTGLTQLTTTSPNNFDPDWQPLVVNVATIEELYSAVNNPQNAGMLVLIAPGFYALSVNDPIGAARPNGGRLELQENMSLQGVVGDRSAVVIDAGNLNSSSGSGAVRIGTGSNAIEWLTIQTAVGGSSINTDLIFPGTAFVRIAHIAASGGTRGIDLRNVGAEAANAVIDAEIIDNDVFNTTEGIRIINQLGANGGVITARFRGNRSHANGAGLLVVNNRSDSANISVTSDGDRFYQNGLGSNIIGGLSSGSIPANGNTVNFTAQGSSFENNNNATFFDVGGLVVRGGENISFPNGTSNNTVNVVLRGCRLTNNQISDLTAVGARSNPVTIGLPGTNNHLKVRLYGTLISTLVTADSIPDYPGGMNSATISRPSLDFDDDGKTDISVFRPSNSSWYRLNSNDDSFFGMQFGVSTDKIAPADFDGDGKTDIAVYRPSTGRWYWLNSSTGAFNAPQFGLAEDLPVPADYDGDGVSNLAVFRPSNGTWYIARPTGPPAQNFDAVPFGTNGDKPTIGDFDGDGKADVAVFRPSNAVWYRLNSSNGAFVAATFGISTDLVSPADFDGDGKTDIAVYRPSSGVWYWLNSSNGTFNAAQFGISEDIPSAADFDGDGRADICVSRPSSGFWYRLNSSNGAFVAVQFGINGDRPTPAAFRY